jgi:hypothetical protein
MENEQWQQSEEKKRQMRVNEDHDAKIDAKRTLLIGLASTASEFCELSQQLQNLVQQCVSDIHGIPGFMPSELLATESRILSMSDLMRTWIYSWMDLRKILKVHPEHDVQLTLPGFERKVWEVPDDLPEG